jgi:hypothetical protein
MNPSNRTVTPIFLFSLPRSGSTLVQRVLSNHQEISTISEPWLLLPFIYATRDEGVLSEYWHTASSMAIREFIDHMPNGTADYEGQLKIFIQNLYQLVSSDDSSYFLDKTPHYHAIAEDIVRIFPNAIFILLLRNPLSVAASINTRFGSSSWSLHRRRFDLYDGLENLLNLKHKYEDRLCIVHYEKLAGEYASAEWERIFAALNLKFDESFLFSIPKDVVQGQMGDKEGVLKYNDISSQSINRWVDVFKNPLRKRWANNYLDWIGEDRLTELGYSYAELKTLLHENRGLEFLFSDLIRMGFGACYTYINIGSFKYNLRKLWHRGSVRQYY